MEFDDLFDELESKFVERSFRWDAKVNALTVQTIDQNFADLIAPIIGIDFVAGLDHSNADWLCFSDQYVASVKTKFVLDQELPLLRRQELKICAFLKTLDRPLRVTAKYLNQFEVAFNLLDADDQFLIAENNQLIPTKAIFQLRMLGTNSWQ